MRKQLEEALEAALRQAGLDTYYSVNQTVANRLVNTRALQEFLESLPAWVEPRDTLDMP